MLLVALPVAAQSQTDDPRKDARSHVGPFYFTPSIALTDFGLDTNVYNAAGEQKSDFTFTLSPHVDAWVPFGRRALLSPSATVDVTYYKTYERERSIGGNIGMRADLFFHRVRLFSQASVAEMRQRPNYEIDIRAKRSQSSLGAGMTVDVTPRLSASLGGSITRMAYNADEVFLGIRLRDTLNRDTKTGTLELRYVLTPLTTVVVRADSGSERFPFSPIRDNDSTRIVSGFEFKPRALISGGATIGIRALRGWHAEMPAFRGVVGSASLSYRLLDATRITLKADRDIAYSIEPLQPYFVLSGYGVSIRRQLIRRFDVIAGGSRNQYDYRLLELQNPAQIASPPAYRFIIHNYSASLGYRFGRDGRIGFGVSYWKRDANLEDRMYDGLRIGTTVTYGVQ